MTNRTQQMQHLSAKLSTLERRADHLQRQLDANACSLGARSFITAELAALSAAMVALRLHHAEVEGLDTPVNVLRQLILALEKHEDLDEELTDLLERASLAVTEYDAALNAAGREGPNGDQQRKGNGTSG